MSERIQAVLKIKLMSDLCSGSGRSFAGVIDTDICSDAFGFPYIPARRIKGCLRDTLESALYRKYPDQADRLFGRGGDDKTSDFVISDAEIEGCAQLKKRIVEKRTAGGETAGLYRAQNILGRFTHVLGQTKVKEDGTAEDTSLRYTRVVNQFTPLKAGREELTFYADISFSAEYQPMVEDMVRATRHVGLKRNRGFGNVRCSLEDVKEATSTDALSVKESEGQLQPKAERTAERLQPESEYSGSSLRALTTEGLTEQLQPESEEPGSALKSSAAGQEGEPQMAVSYTIRNLAPLMLSGTDETVSAAHITGQSVLGALAARYLSFPGKNADTEEFRDLFLNGTVQYSNAYPEEDSAVYYPAPFFVQKLKKSGEYVGVIACSLPKYADGNRESSYNPAGGNQPKKLKGKYLCWDAKTAAEYEVRRDLIYHHRHEIPADSQIRNAFNEQNEQKEHSEQKKIIEQNEQIETKEFNEQPEQGKQKEQEGMLYSQETVCPDQCFRGTIFLPQKYVGIIEKLLHSGDFYFGKSRSAQYGRCRIGNIFPHDGLPETKRVEAGEHLVVTFLSDALFFSDRGEYTVYMDEVSELVKRELHIEPEKEEDPPYLSSVQTTTAAGYLGTWNLRKEVKPAVAAGSYLVYRLTEPFETSRMFIGERNLEGYGHIRIDCAEDMVYEMKTGIPAGSGMNAGNRAGYGRKDQCPGMAASSSDAGSGEGNDLKGKSTGLQAGIPAGAVVFAEKAEDRSTSGTAALANLMSDILIHFWLEQMEYNYLKDGSGRVKISNTALGRVTLMLKESLEENRTDPEAAFTSFAGRIKSIKSNDTRKEAGKILKLVGEYDKRQKCWNLTFAAKVREAGIQAGEEPQKLGIAEQEMDKRINQRWGEYLMYILTEQKYEGDSR